MGFTWAFVGAFEIAKAKLATLKKQEPAWLTELADIAEDPTQLVDRIYDGPRFVHRRLFDSSGHAGAVKAVQQVLANVAKAGGTGSGAVVRFVDGGPDNAGITFEVARGEVRESPIKTKKDVTTWTKSAAYGGLVERYQAAFADEDAEHAPAALPEALVTWLEHIADVELVRGARAANIKMGVIDDKRGLTMMPVVKKFPDAKKLRAALKAAVQAPTKPAHIESGLAPAALELYAAMERPAALATVRAFIDAGSSGLLADAGYQVLASSTEDADLERIWRAIPRPKDRWDETVGLHPAVIALLASRHAHVDARVLAELSTCVGKPGQWKPIEDKLAWALVMTRVLLWRHADSGRALVVAAEQGHPEEQFRVRAKRLIGQAPRTSTRLPD